MSKRYVTTQDILIPAGTEVGAPPQRSSRWGEDYEAVVGHGRDHTSYWTVNLDDAIELGLVREA
jgi:hypothetical protein